MTSLPALSRSTNIDAMVTSKTINGNSEKNALKANAPAHCAPSIRENFLRPRQSTAQTSRNSCSTLLGLPKGRRARAYLAGDHQATLLGRWLIHAGSPSNRGNLIFERGWTSCPWLFAAGLQAWLVTHSTPAARRAGSGGSD